jgi:hypothetical protein
MPLKHLEILVDLDNKNASLEYFKALKESILEAKYSDKWILLTKNSIG